MKKGFPIIKILSLLVGVLIPVFIFIFFPSPRSDVIVPNVIGKDFAMAFDILSAYKLKIEKVSEKYHDTFPEGSVISQTPSPGKRVKEGRKIQVVVSSGQEIFEMPDLRNYTLREAKERLSEISKGLRIKTISSVYANIPKGRIITQTPLPFSKIKKGEGISVLLSLGPRPKSFLIPEFTEMKGHCVNNREDEGLSVEEVDNDLDEVSNYEEVESTCRTIIYSVPRGVYEKEVRIVVVDRMGEHVVYNKKERPGEEVVVSTQVSIPAKVRIYLEGILVEERRIDD